MSIHTRPRTVSDPRVTDPRTVTGPRTALPRPGIDPRGPRLAAAITTAVLAAVLLTGSILLLVVQAAVFAVGAFGGVQRSPYGWAFRRLVRPRLRPPADLEDPAPPRFAQSVGLGFALAGLLGAALAAAAGAGTAAATAGQTVFLAATGAALAAAFLNAAFGFCLGCEIYLLIRRIRRTPSRTREEIHP